MIRVARTPVARPIATLIATVPAKATTASPGPIGDDHGLQRDREQDQAGAVVEEALAVDHRRQRRRALAVA